MIASDQSRIRWYSLSISVDPVSFGGIGDLSLTQALLVDLGVAHYVITRDLLDRPKARPDPLIRRFADSLIRRPRGTGWEVLS